MEGGRDAVIPGRGQASLGVRPPGVRLFPACAGKRRPAGAGHCMGRAYLPTQNREKISSMIFSSTRSPVMAPRCDIAS